MAKPNKMVFNGVSEFKIEATALSISVSAKAKKKAGKKVPSKPEMITHFQSFLLMVLIDLKPATNRNNPVIMTLKAPN